jgi:hypothetical protein
MVIALHLEASYGGSESIYGVPGLGLLAVAMR